MSLSCVYMIQKQLKLSNHFEIENIHLHKRYDKSVNIQAFNIDSMRHIPNFEIVRTRGRSMNSENRIKKQKLSKIQHIKSLRNSNGLKAI